MFFGSVVKFYWRVWAAERGIRRMLKREQHQTQLRPLKAAVLAASLACMAIIIAVSMVVSMTHGITVPRPQTIERDEEEG
jgi:ABC-type xylose transport system permease subunit